jgi:hypothetical protein
MALLWRAHSKVVAAFGYILLYQHPYQWRSFLTALQLPSQRKQHLFSHSAAACGSAVNVHAATKCSAVLSGQPSCSLHVLVQGGLAATEVLGVAWVLLGCCCCCCCAGKQVIVLCETGGSIENKSGTKVSTLMGVLLKPCSAQQPQRAPKHQRAPE